MFIFTLYPRAATVSLRMRRFRVLACDIVNPDVRVYPGLNDRVVGRIESSGEEEEADIHFDIKLESADYNPNQLVRAINNAVSKETEIKEPVCDLNDAGFVVLRSGVILSGSEEASIASALGFAEADVAFGRAPYLPQNIYAFARMHPHAQLYDEMKRKQEFVKNILQSWSAEMTENVTMMMNGRLVAVIYMGAPGFRSRRVISSYVSLQGSKNNFKTFELMRHGAPLFSLLKRAAAGVQVILSTS